MTEVPGKRRAMLLLGYGLVWIVIRLVAAVLFRFRVRGDENVPATGGAIIAANHASYLDPPLVGTSVPRLTCYMAAEELFRIPVFGWLIRALGSFPVKRGGDDRGALREGIRRLKQGRLLMVFPEGTRSFHAELGEGKAGIGFIALHAGVPIVPAYIQGTHEALPRGRWWIRPVRVTVLFGPPIPPPSDGVPRGEAARRVYQEISDRVMAEIAALKKQSEERRERRSTVNGQ